MATFEISNNLSNSTTYEPKEPYKEKRHQETGRDKALQLYTICTEYGNARAHLIAIIATIAPMRNTILYTHLKYSFT